MPEDRISTRFDFWFLIYKCFKVLIGTCFGNLVAIGSQLNKTRKNVRNLPHKGSFVISACGYDYWQLDKFSIREISQMRK